MARLPVAVLISGRGSNLSALIEAASEDDYPAEIALVISNVAGAGGLVHAAAAGIACQTIQHTDFADRESFEDAINDALKRAGVELVCLAGFMRLLTENFVTRWRDRLINIHPSLLPAFRGLHVHERVLAYGARFSGCTVHFVRPAMDDGPILIQSAVPVHSDDDAATLAARVLAEEHIIYPMAVQLIAEQRVRVVNEKVMIAGAASPRGAVVNPAPRRRTS